MAFPLLKLPFLAYEKVLLNLEVADLVDFSLISSRCHRIIRSIRFPFTRIDLRLGSGNGLEFYKGLQLIAQWFFKKNDGASYQTLKSPEWHSTQKPIKNIKIALDYVRDLFRLPIISYHIQLTNQYLFPHDITKCDELRLDLSDGVPIDELKYVLEKVEILKKFHLNLPENFVFEYGFIQFLLDELYINRAFWITNKTFLAMDCARIELHGNENLPIRDFVSQWLLSKNNRFEWLKMSRNREQINWTDGFKTMKWNPKTRGRNFKLSDYSRVDCDNGIDILREDGLLASVVEEYGAIYFVVWHRRFQPEADQLQLDNYNII
uniref:F-box domain-containing protein n=1 Tax=Caenorhabditis tropicalis TaxID=1561998 RepID=A0A1I7TKY4_9PELO